jgi:hypothetical protein
MFYLKHFILLFKKFPVRWILFFLTSALSFLVIQSQDIILKKLLSFSGEEKLNPYLWYFAQDTEKENYQYWKSTLSQIKDVEKFELIASNKIKIKLSEDLANLEKQNLLIPQSLIDKTGFALKIYFKRDVEAFSEKETRKYLQNLMPEKAIVGPTKWPNQNEKIRIEIWHSLIKNILPAASIIISLFMWLWSFYNLMGPVGEFSKIIELYQRRKYVELKIFASSFVPISLIIIPLQVGLSLGLGVILWQELIFIILFFCLVTFFIGIKYQIQNRAT